MDQSAHDILRYLGQEPRKVSLGQIAYNIHRDRATVYRQLVKLREAGAIRCTREYAGIPYDIEVVNE